LIPEVNDDLCDYCGKCASACEYNALVALPKQVMVFPELCHGCEQDAIARKERVSGYAFILKTN